MHVFPSERDRSSLKPHIDHSGPRMSPKWAIECLEDRGWDECCLPMKMSTMHYLTPVPDARHGATVVWPRSHTLLGTLIASDPIEYARSDVRHRSIFKTVGSRLAEAGVFGVDPVEVMVGAGDVMFADIMLVHAGSLNNSSDVRLAFNMKMGPRGQRCK